VDRLRLVVRRMADLGSTLVDTFVRDNRVLPPVLAVLALFIIAWILAGAFMGEPDQETVAHKADLAQSDGGKSGGDPAPGVENRDVNSYAAYRSKDPFRELLAPEDTTAEQPATTTPEQTTPESTTGPGGTPGAGGANRDSDDDGVSNRRERRVGTDPNTPDTDGDGTRDGSDDANDDGRPGTTPGGTTGAGQPGRGGGRGQGGNDDGLLNSGGTLPVP
jgi:hypothetical protein